jgi:hypothetical protein
LDLTKDLTSSTTTELSNGSVPVPVEQEERLAVVRQDMEDGIRKIKGPRAERLLDLWADISQNNDINEFVRQNLQTNQLHIQEAVSKYWERKANNDKIIEALQDKLIDGDVDSLQKYQAELERIDKEERRDHLYISTLMKSSTSFAKEYRQCATQRKSSVDIAQVQKLLMMIQASIHRYVHDEKVLDSISQDFMQACIEFLPVSSDTDLGA